MLYECIKEIKNQPECHRRVENNCYIKTHIKAVTKKNTKIPAGFSHVIAFSFVSFWHICVTCAHNLTDIKTTLVYFTGPSIISRKNSPNKLSYICYAPLLGLSWKTGRRRIDKLSTFFSICHMGGPWKGGIVTLEVDKVLNNLLSRSQQNLKV